ncbi:MULTISPECIES: signal peptidase II [Arthrobacter]|uniref:Lipoprotein signal peptidase n=2 Tax=Arthrobacter TaxID=1663 RepID=A0ABU9KH30_9MICC|nr:signal peptidase II [Arthrobacter sp. YJM1]MDP5226193.1 signal peptidase II [Arthrobacter sp. YJM1]
MSSSPADQGPESEVPGGTVPEPEEAAISPVRRHGPVLALFAAAAVFAYGLDQLTKFLVSTGMTEYESIPVLPPLLHWYYIRNSGAAFSIGENYTWVFTIIMTLVSAAVLVYIRRVGSLWWGLALGFLLGGALGNLTDRLFRAPSFGMGHVVDFIQLPNFAIFNVADSAVVTAVTVIVILTLKGVAADGRKRAPGDSGAGDAGEAGK